MKISNLLYYIIFSAALTQSFAFAADSSHTPSSATSFTFVDRKIESLERRVMLLEKSLRGIVLRKDLIEFPDKEKKDYENIKNLMNNKQWTLVREKSKKFLKNYDDSSRSDAVHNMLGNAYYANRDYKEALKHFRDGYKSNPKGDMSSQNQLGIAISLPHISHKGDASHDEACKVLRKLAQSSKSSNVRNQATLSTDEMKCAQ